MFMFCIIVRMPLMRPANNSAAADAPDAIFGYCVGNDMTERMWQHAVPQWSLGKSFDTHAPMGPWIVTADELGEPSPQPTSRSRHLENQVAV